jgi:hypothetical protein
MRPCEVGLRQTRTSWGLRLTRPGLALGGVPRPDGAAGGRAVWCVHDERGRPVWAGPAFGRFQKGQSASVISGASQWMQVASWSCQVSMVRIV